MQRNTRKLEVWLNIIETESRFRSGALYIFFAFIMVKVNVRLLDYMVKSR